MAAVVSGAMSTADHSARNAYRAGHYKEAMTLWAPRAAIGDPTAQLGLAMMFDFGQGVPRNPIAAYHWYKRAAQAGLTEAEFDLAVIYDSGAGTPHNAAAAALWYARAATHGDHRAEYNLGLLYQTGDGVPRNLVVARAWFRAAATLPAVSRKLAHLQSQILTGMSAGAAASGAAPTAAQRLRPSDGATIGSGRGRADVELVWTAPSQPAPVRFFVQVLALAKGTKPREVFDTYVDTTAVLAPLQASHGQYAWRVYTVANDGIHYTASAWARFQF